MKTTLDDFGLNKAANKAIMCLVKKRRAHFVSLLVNMEETRNAVSLFRKSPSCRIGLHVNLVEGKPVSPSRKVYTLVGKNNEFHPLPILLLRLAAGKIKRTHIRTEMENQIREYKQHRLACSHINTHQNIHMFYPFNRILADLARKHKVPFIRQESSVLRRLKKFPHKYAAYLALRFLLNRRSRPDETEGFEEILLHPGTSYD